MSAAPTLNRPSVADLERLERIVGAGHAITDPEMQAPYLTEWRDLYLGRTPMVVRPGSTAEVAAILKFANERRIGIVPQGGNTGLVGGQIPSAAGREIVVSLARLNGVREIAEGGTHMIAEAGVTLRAVQDAAEGAGRLFPLSLASEDSCQIGGVMATNAGGVAVLAYGNARQLALGLEVVLADGCVMTGLRALKKDNTGYDLRDLFIGSEGTLGIITAACLRLYPRPAEMATAFVALAGIDDVAALFQRAEGVAEGQLTAFEFLSDAALGMALAHVAGTRMPFAKRAPWYVLIELSGSRGNGSTGRALEQMLTAAALAGEIGEATIAASLAQVAALWRLREGLSAAPKPEGGSIKHDIAVPVALIPRFLREAVPLVEAVCPGARPVPFGHFGDGNVHYNVSQPAQMDKAAFLALWGPMTAAVHGLVRSLGGSISAEHGIGQMKRAELIATKPAAELAAMRAIKAALDPHGILNPGKVL